MERGDIIINRQTDGQTGFLGNGLEVEIISRHFVIETDDGRETRSSIEGYITICCIVLIIDAGLFFFIVL